MCRVRLAVVQYSAAHTPQNSTLHHSGCSSRPAGLPAGVSSFLLFSSFLVSVLRRNARCCCALLVVSPITPQSYHYHTPHGTWAGLVRLLQARRGRAAPATSTRRCTWRRPGRPSTISRTTRRARAACLRCTKSPTPSTRTAGSAVSRSFCVQCEETGRVLPFTFKAITKTAPFEGFRGSCISLLKTISRMATALLSLPAFGFP